MTVHFLSIVLDGMPWITMHYPMMRTLPFDWVWHVVEGVAEPVECTSWCKRIPPRLSEDGTTQYLDSIDFDDRVRIYRRKSWRGKIQMVNEPLAHITEKCLLWQIDSDEVWTAQQIDRMRRMFLSDPSRTSAQFYCRYFVGPNLVTTDFGLYGNRDYDWIRVWRFKPGMKFLSHEPPRLTGDTGPRFSQMETAASGLIFDHFAYALEPTVAFKQRYYAGKHNHYDNAVANWQKLQANKVFPAKLRKFFRWVDDDQRVVRINE